MAVLIDKSTKVIVQGFTGKEGSFHSEQMIKYGTQIVGGVTPGKGGAEYLGKPIFNTMKEAVKITGAKTSIVFVPRNFAADAMMEAADAGIKLIICITEGIPSLDIIKVKSYISQRGCRLIGPNCPGIITSEESKIGIMPGFLFKKGRVGIISKSGTLTYEAADQVVRAGFGISTAIGVGGDPIIGTTIKEMLELFMYDEDTDCIVMIGEIGGQLEIEAARWYKNIQYKKPVIAFIAGQSAPKGRTMGHAGAIVGENDTAQIKMQALLENGIYVVESPAEIGLAVTKVLNQNIK